MVDIRIPTCSPVFSAVSLHTPKRRGKLCRARVRYLCMDGRTVHSRRIGRGRGRRSKGKTFDCAFRPLSAASEQISAWKPEIGLVVLQRPDSVIVSRWRRAKNKEALATTKGNGWANDSRTTERDRHAHRERLPRDGFFQRASLSTKLSHARHCNGGLTRVQGLRASPVSSPLNSWDNDKRVLGQLAQTETMVGEPDRINGTATLRSWQ